jgi:MarR family transcriptional regulator, lower aerobic nicotinate degradation pathway regulator
MDHAPPEAPEGDYRLDVQAGFLLRRATQRHLAIFAGLIPVLTPTQFAALARLAELGPTSQNALGRATAMDAATIKGVIDRLRQRGLVASTRDPDDQRRIHVAATPAGLALFADLQARAFQISRDTLAPLTPREQAQFLALLAKIT